MHAGEPSRTAHGAALLRAVHQQRDGAAVLVDPFVARQLDADALAAALAEPETVAGRMRRLFIAARSRVAEDVVAEAVARGTRQVVVLGAGLDTFGLRQPHRGAGLRVFEVDHPATQAWKRERLAAAGVIAPDDLVFVPVDFEQDGLAAQLTEAGFRFDRPAVVLWLGVVPYLTPAAVGATLDVLATLPVCDLILDYYEAVPAEVARAQTGDLAERVAKAGEPFLCQPAAVEMAAWLRDRDFSLVADIRPADLADRFGVAVPSTVSQGPGAHILHVRRG